MTKLRVYFLSIACEKIHLPKTLEGDMEKWRILDTGRRSAEENMCLDKELLLRLDEYSEPTVHFYDWVEDSATYGYFVNPRDFLDVEKAKEKNLQLARRPTGGGIIFHTWDFAFSVLVPSHSEFFSQNTLDNYEFINRAVLRAVQELLGQQLSLIPSDGEELDLACGRFCMAKPTKYDVLLQGKKIVGAAQRQTKKGFLHQGSISLANPCWQYLEEILLPGTRVLEAMKLHTMSFSLDLQAARRKVRLLLQKHLTGEDGFTHS